MPAQVTITIGNDGTVGVEFRPRPRPGAREFRQEAAALCLHLLNSVYGTPLKEKPGAVVRRADASRTNHETRGRNHE